MCNQAVRFLDELKHAIPPNPAGVRVGAPDLKDLTDNTVSSLERSYCSKGLKGSDALWEGVELSDASVHLLDDLG